MYSNKETLKKEVEVEKVNIVDSNPGSYRGLGFAMTYEDLKISSMNKA